MSTEAENNNTLQEGASQENNQSKESKKIAENYERTMQNLIAVFQGESKIAPAKRIDGDDISALIDEVIADDIKAKKEEFKTKAKDLMKAKVAYDNFIKQKELEFQKQKDDKTKEFTKQATDLINMIDGIGKLKQTYFDSLSSSSTTTNIELEDGKE